MDFSRVLVAAFVLATLGLSGCATNPMRSYDSELKQTGNDLASNNAAKALADHEAANSGKFSGEKDLLYFLEKGNLLRFNNQLPESRDAWLKADEKVRVWEEEAKTSPEKILSYIGTAVVNDKMLRYDGQDFEKVMLSTNLALDHILLGNWDMARTEIKKMHEREAIIADIRAKEIEKIEEEAKSRNVKTEIKELKGYPVETLNDPEVTKLKNSYQSAFSHYLAGFVYEALNEPSLAAPGYRKAVELRPGIKILEDGLKNLDKRTGSRAGKAGLTDVLFVVESGSAPARKSVSIPIPGVIPGQGAASGAAQGAVLGASLGALLGSNPSADSGKPAATTASSATENAVAGAVLGSLLGGGQSLTVVPISFPIIESAKFTPPTSLTLDNGSKVGLSSVTNIDAMSRRALKDDMPGIILRGTIRAITKTVAQNQAQKHGGGLLGAAVSIAAIATESADERGWRTLPADISIARVQLPAGKHSVDIAGKKLDIEVDGRYLVYPIRLAGPTAYAAQPVMQKLAYLTDSVAEKAEPGPTDQPTKKTRNLKKKALAGKKTPPAVQ